jgi:hypothetical protein
VKFSFAYQLYSRDGYNLSESGYHHKEIYERCNFNPDIKPSEINDADVMRCILDDRLLRGYYRFLYCEPPKILDENNECALEIDFEQWQNVLESLPKSSYDRFVKFIYLENEDSKKQRVIGKWILAGTDQRIFAAIGKTSKDKYELLTLQTCRDEIAELTEKNQDMIQENFVLLPILAPQLMSIICFLILLIFYLTIEDLKTTIYGKCWINFIVNSLINYLATIFVLALPQSPESREIMIITIMMLLTAFTIIFTEFSLYYWLNITFFEAFYIIR